MVAPIENDYATHSINNFVKHIEKNIEKLDEILERMRSITLAEKPAGRPILSVEKGDEESYIIRRVFESDGKIFSEESYCLKIKPVGNGILMYIMDEYTGKTVVGDSYLIDLNNFKEILVRYAYNKNIKEFTKSMKPYRSCKILED